MSGYALAGYLVTFGVLAAYVGRVVVRTRNLKRLFKDS